MEKTDLPCKVLQSYLKLHEKKISVFKKFEI